MHTSNEQVHFDFHLYNLVLLPISALQVSVFDLLHSVVWIYNYVCRVLQEMLQFLLFIGSCCQIGNVWAHVTSSAAGGNL